MSTTRKRVATNKLSLSTEHYREAYSGLGTGLFHNNIFKNEKKGLFFFPILEASYQTNYFKQGSREMKSAEIET